MRKITYFMLLGATVVVVAVVVLFFYMVTDVDNDPWFYLLTQAVLRFFLLDTRLCEISVSICMFVVVQSVRKKKGKGASVSLPPVKAEQAGLLAGEAKRDVETYEKYDEAQAS